MMKAFAQFIRGIWEENPIFRLVLGMCPTLAVTTSFENALGMGMASTFVLVCSNVVISSVRKLIPSKVRIPCFIVIIATFVTIVDMLMAAYAPALHKSLGIFIPLIVVNCIILGRAEAYASKHSLFLSFADGLGMGIGFTLGLLLIGTVREVIGSNTITIWGDLAFHLPAVKPVVLAILPPGGFMALGFLLAMMNRIQDALARRKGKRYLAPPHLDCRHCTICKFGE